MASLFMIRGNDQGRRFDLDGAVITIGRDASNLIQLHDTEVSRRHAEVRRVDGVDYLVDLGSSNGLFVNGRAVREQRLENGDQIQIGRGLMLYTRPVDESLSGITDQIDITTDAFTAEKSRIIHSISQEEGSRIFDFASDMAQAATAARTQSHLQVMYQTAMAVSHMMDIDQLLGRIMEIIFEWVAADRGCIMLLENDKQGLVPKVRRTRGGTQNEKRIRISKTILDYVLQRREGVLTSDARQDERWQPGASIVQMGVREAICVPMQGRYGMVGIIYIDTLTLPQDIIAQHRLGKQTNKFAEDHLKLMISIAHQAALAVEDTRYHVGMVQAERLAAIGQTVAILSHHIKNILQGIRGGSYLIEMGLAKHDETLIGKGWNIVEKNQSKISNLVLDMLTFSKEREPDLSESDINQVVADVVELMQGRAADLEVSLSLAPPEPIPTLVFDPEGLHRAVMNIVTNAIDAANEVDHDGAVRVSVEYLAAAKTVRILVEDNGPGITRDELKTLFTPFVSSKGGRGTGLGLPVSQKILQEHGGRIEVEGSPGQGSRFMMYLPVVLPESGPATLTSDVARPDQVRADRADA